MRYTEKNYLFSVYKALYNLMVIKGVTVDHTIHNTKATFITALEALQPAELTKAVILYPPNDYVSREVRFNGVYMQLYRATQSDINIPIPSNYGYRDLEINMTILGINEPNALTILRYVEYLFGTRKGFPYFDASNNAYDFELDLIAHNISVTESDTPEIEQIREVQVQFKLMNCLIDLSDLNDTVYAPLAELTLLLNSDPALVLEKTFIT